MLKIPEDYINMYSEIKPAYRKVYNILRATILSGQISSAVHLTEVSISQALHVSRTPVRMALEQLKNDGILSTVKKNRVGVKQLSKSDKINLLFLDELLESTAARLAATAITDEDLETLMELNDSMREFSYNEKDVPDIRVNGVRGQDGEGSGSEGKFRSHGRMLRCEAFLFHGADKRFVGLTVVDIITADDILYIKGIETSDQSGNMVGIIMAADQIVDG